MATKHDLIDWLQEALVASSGRGRIADLCKSVWDMHEGELRTSGELFYTWQYDIRWAAYQLRKARKLKPDTISPKGIWELSGNQPKNSFNPERLFLWRSKASRLS
jgi:hypothetical protein